METIVYKFGGSYLKEIKNLTKIYRLINRKIKKYQIILVVSAIGRDNDPYSTKTLLGYGTYLNTHEKDALLSIGEQFSSLKMTNYLKSKGINARTILLNELGINLDESYKLDNTYLEMLFRDYDVLVVPGFICKEKENYIKTLGRGGSDLTALLHANMLNLDEVYLHKETIGVLSSISPCILNKEILDKLSYEQAIRYFTYSGEMVQIKALEYAKENNIKIHIFNVDSKKETIISDEENDWCIYGILNIDNIIYLFGKTDDYTLTIIKDFLRDFKNIKYKIKVGLIELSMDEAYIENIMIELHKRFIE